MTTTSMVSVSASPAAEERLSVTTAIMGLLAVGGKTTDILWDLNTPADKENNVIFVQALQEIKQCRSTVHVLYKTLSLLEPAQLPYSERATWIKAEHLMAILTDTVLAMSDLQSICEALILEKEGLATLPPAKENAGVGIECDSSRVNAKAIEGLCSRIRWHNLSMTMAMTILKCPGESDAQNSRVSLERRMTRLLTANTKLSTRMRQLDHVFDRHRLGRAWLPNYSLPARHAHFSALPRLAPYPGTAAAMQLSAHAAEGPATAGGSEGGGRTQALRPLSVYTLADMPVLSMIPLPVTTSELADGPLFYTSAYAWRVGRDLAELMQNQAGQGTSRSLGVILGRMNTSVGHGHGHGASSSSTGESSSEESPELMGTGAGAGAGGDANDTQMEMKAKKWKVRSLHVGRRWRV